MASFCRSRYDLAVFEAKAGAFEIDQVGVVDDAANHCGCDDEVSGYVTPAGKRQGACHD